MEIPSTNETFNPVIKKPIWQERRGCPPFDKIWQRSKQQLRKWHCSRFARVSVSAFTSAIYGLRKSDK
jgi:hypothetical protein